MWNPSIRVSVPVMERQDKFEELCCHYHEFYSQYLKQFTIMATLVEHFHVKYGIEKALLKGSASSTVGRLIMMITLTPEYKYAYGDPEYSIKDKIAFRDDYYTTFSLCINGFDDEYEATIGLKAMTKNGILLTEIPAFPTDKYNEQELPDWFVDTVKDFLK